MEEDKEETSKTSEPVEDEEEKESLVSPDQMDDLIKRNFLMCIIRHIKDSELPLEPSQLQGDYMHKYEHEEDGKLDFKKSNYKKITKFLKKMKQQKLISFAKPKGKDHEIITDINRKSKLNGLMHI